MPVRKFRSVEEMDMIWRLAGGPPTDIVDAPNGRGGTWNEDNVIVFDSTAGPLPRVAATGGAPVAIAALDTTYGETSHRFPAFLEDGRHFVYAAVVGTCCPPPKAGRLRIGSVDGADLGTLLQVDSALVHKPGQA